MADDAAEDAKPSGVEEGAGLPAYVFRGGHGSTAANTVVTVAPLDFVVSVYGGGGLKGEAGLAAVFGGAAFFAMRKRGTVFSAYGVLARLLALGTRFGAAAQRLEFIPQHPPARLIWTQSE
jgi:hypothetical protein